jgi:hypothetical protein
MVQYEDVFNNESFENNTVSISAMCTGWKETFWGQSHFLLSFPPPTCVYTVCLVRVCEFLSLEVLQEKLEDAGRCG